MKFFKLFICVLISSAIVASCNEGPAERKGKKVDNAVENLQDKINPKGPVQKAGKKIDDAVGN